MKIALYALVTAATLQFLVPGTAEAAARCGNRKCVTTRNVHVIHHYRPRPVHYVPHYRRWYHQPHYGAVVAGVTLGTVIVVSAATAPRPPSSYLCWYWANSAHTKGYWDYCY